MPTEVVQFALQYATSSRSYRRNEAGKANFIGIPLVERASPDRFPYVKAIQLLPLAYFADVHGFIYFVPYMLFVMVIAQVLGASRRRARKVSPHNEQSAASIVPVDAGQEAVLATVRS